MKTYSKSELYGENNLNQTYKGYSINYHGYFDAYLISKNGEVDYNNQFDSIFSAKKHIDKL